ncbi:hypothetical protein AKO1_010866, partial [Acrasis kona]
SRVLIQRVQKASLLINNVDQWSNINEGVIIFVSFLKGATIEQIPDIVQNLFQIKCYKQGLSLTDASCDIMIVPQASLGGKPKQKSVQFHNLVDKSQAEPIYLSFCDHVKSKTKSTFVQGTYGNNQGLKIESDGPYTHFFEL